MPDANLNPRLYPTLVLLVGESSFAFADRFSRWLETDIEGGFPLEKFTKQTSRSERLWSIAKGLTLFGLKSNAEGRFVGVNDRTDVRIVLVCETSAIKDLKEALLVCLEAEKRWRDEGRDSLALRCRILLYGPAVGDPISQVRRLIEETFPIGNAVPITLYLSDSNGPAVLRPEYLLDAVEIMLSILVLGDQSAGGALERTWRQSDGAVFTVALREHWHEGLEDSLRSIIAEAVKKRLDSFMRGEPVSRLKLRAIIEDLVRKEHVDLLTSISANSEPWLRQNYERALPGILIDSAKYVRDEEEFRDILGELANVAETIPNSESLLRQPEITSVKSDSVYARILAWLRRLFRFSAKHRTVQSDLKNVSTAGDSIDRGTPAISRFLRDLVGSLSAAPPHTGPPWNISNAGLPVTCHEWRAGKFEVSPELRESMIRNAEEYLIEVSADITTLLAFQLLVGNSTLRDAANRARQFKAHLQLLLLRKLNEAWLDASLRVDEQEDNDHRWKEHIYFNQIPPAPQLTTLLCASNQIVNQFNLSTKATVVPSFLPSDRLFFIRLIKV